MSLKIPKDNQELENLGKDFVYHVFNEKIKKGQLDEKLLKRFEMAEKNYFDQDFFMRCLEKEDFTFLKEYVDAFLDESEFDYYDSDYSDEGLSDDDIMDLGGNVVFISKFLMKAIIVKLAQSGRLLEAREKVKNEFGPKIEDMEKEQGVEDPKQHTKSMEDIVLGKLDEEEVLKECKTLIKNAFENIKGFLTKLFGDKPKWTKEKAERMVQILKPKRKKERKKPIKKGRRRRKFSVIDKNLLLKGNNKLTGVTRKRTDDTSEPNKRVKHN